MALNGIDISNWQNGIDVSVVPSDFVICKSTEGTGYVSPDFNRQISQASSCGKLIGVYHYINGSGAKGEMDHFLKAISPWVRKALICLDWEPGSNAAWQNESYLSQCVDLVKQRTGIPPVIYSSKSYFPWNLAKDKNSGDWVAQYADNNPTGYQSDPWNNFDCLIRQYSSTGRLPGWSGNLDLNLAKCSREVWMKYVDPDNPVPPPIDEGNDSGSVPDLDSYNALDLAVLVMKGDLGDGDERKAKLGDRYDEVQSIINHVYTASTQELVDETWAGRYLNGSERKAILGPRYEEVMAVINGGSKIYVVSSGDTLSSIASKFGLTYQQLAESNGISNPNLIYPGQRIKIG